ncbi:MAG: dienelactone hydrolase family protein [Comamonas sp.]
MQDLQADFDSLLPRSTTSAGNTRRSALKLALGVGYAAAAAPIMAQTAVNTPDTGLTAGSIKINVDGFDVPAYRAAPAGKTNLPVVLVIQEIFGVHDYIADTCRRLAKLGYLAIAPELFARQGDPRKYTEISQLQAELVSKVPDAQVMKDLDAALDWAKANGGDVSRAGITGFCWGGRITWLYAATGKVKAGVAWYGRLEGTVSSLQPKHPTDITKDLQAPVLGLYGGKDQGIPMDSVDAMKHDLQTAAKAGNAAAAASTFHIYPDAGHAFHADYRPSYRKDAAEDGWKRMQDWFKAKGVI